MNGYACYCTGGGERVNRYANCGSDGGEWRTDMHAVVVVVVVVRGQTYADCGGLGVEGANRYTCCDSGGGEGANGYYVLVVVVLKGETDAHVMVLVVVRE